MAQTTTKVNACDVSVWLDNASGTLQDVSGSSNGIDMSFSRELGELRTFQSKWPVRMGCGKDVEIGFRAVYSTAADEAAHILKNWFFESTPGSRSVHVYVPDKNVGSDHYYGEVTLGDMSFSADPTEAGPIAIECTLMADGEFSLTTATT
jgi:hypothetical protein